MKSLWCVNAWVSSWVPWGAMILSCFAQPAQYDIAWHRSYSALHDGSGEDHLLAMAVDKSGNVAVTGKCWKGESYDHVTIKYTAGSGQLIWRRHHHHPENRNIAPVAIATDGAGNVIVTGFDIGKPY